MKDIVSLNKKAFKPKHKTYMVNLKFEFANLSSLCLYCLVYKLFTTDIRLFDRDIPDR